MASNGIPNSTSRLKRELLFAVLGLALGLVLLPLLIYLVGQVILGTYSGGKQGFGSFYGDLIRDLAAPRFNSWVIVAGPYLMMLGLRLIFLRGSAPNRNAPNDGQIGRSKRIKQRKEPTLGL